MSAADNYLRDVLPQLVARAKEARREAAGQAPGTSAADFSTGRRTAYYEVVAILLGELEAFGIPRQAVGVPDAFDPERDLL